MLKTVSNIKNKYKNLFYQCKNDKVPLSFHDNIHEKNRE